MNRNFWDLNQDQKLDAGEISRALFMLLCYVGGPILMITTAARSFHLLSSPAMNPGGTGWWAILWALITALTPELGLLTAWLAGETGWRKGRWELVAVSALGVIIFTTVIGTIQLYDTALLGGGDISLASEWGHWIASVMPLITIIYLVVCNSLGAAMARMDEVKNPRRVAVSNESWQSVPRQQLPVSVQPQIPVRPQRPLGEPIHDPLSGKRPVKAGNGHGPRSPIEIEEDFS